METKQDWYFTSNGNGEVTGWNDPGIATFQKTPVESLVREVIQNSLDARIDKRNKPAVVEFNEFKIPIKIFPGYETYAKCLKKCLERSRESQDSKGIKALEKQVELFSNPEHVLRVLRVSDYNTTGLIGADDTNDVDSTWYRLVKGNGVANQDKGAGGSFGIGKSAAFSCSASRCIFYASLDKKNVKSYIGITRLISFSDDALKSDDNINGWTTGLGIYSDNRQKNAILELPDFEPEFKRDESGTDIYIMGVPDEFEELRNKIVWSILNNYLVAVWSEKLVVKISYENNTDVINTESLGDYIAETVAHRTTVEEAYVKEDVQAALTLQDYFDVLTNKFPDNTEIISLNAVDYGEKYGFHDGDMTLYLMKKENANRRIMINREAGMKLFEQKNLNGQIQFTGILIMSGEKMNEDFRNLENPEHNSWTIPDEYKNSREYRRYKTMYDDLKKYMREQIKKYFQSTYNDEVFAFGASDFLPDEPEISIKGSKSQVKESLKQKTTGFVQKKMKAVTSQRSKVNGEDSGLEDSGNQDNGQGQPNKGIQPKKGKSKTEDTSLPLVDINATYTQVSLPNVRVINLDKNSGKYRLKFRVPHTSKQVKLALDVVGEQSAFKIPIKYAEVVQGNAKVGECKGNEIILLQVKLGSVVYLDVDIAFDQFSLLEVKYSEVK